MQRITKILVLAVLFGCLVAIRVFATQWFYDPLIDFFKGNHSTASLPEMNLGKLLLHIGLRFWMNTILSLAVLWILFKQRGILRFSLVLYVLVFVVLLFVFWVLVNTSEVGEHMGLFYVRRFLIQSLLLLLLIPAFYFHKFRN